MLVYFWVEPDSQDLLGGVEVEPLGKRGRKVNVKPLGDFLCPAMRVYLPHMSLPPGRGW